MKILRCTIPDVLVLEPRVFRDSRGWFCETWNDRVFRDQTGVNVSFVQDNHSSSSRDVLRGLHYQIDRPQGKLIRVVRGTVFDVVVDLRRQSRWFGQWVGIELSEEDGRLLWVPAGFAHGFLVLSDRADMLYKATDYFSPAGERTLAWNDPAIGVAWPLTDGIVPVLSEKDVVGVPLGKAEVYAWAGPEEAPAASFLAT